MNSAVTSLLALIAVIVASLFSRVNVGVLAVALAWPVALYGAGWKTDALIQTFPSSLFLTLLGISLLFGVSQTNGTMEAVTLRAVRMCRGRAAMLPPLLFFIACTVATLGPGAISATALVAPPAMAIGAAAGIPPFLTALMVGNGANAGNLSPISAVGLIVQSLMRGAGLGGHEWSVWLQISSFIAWPASARGSCLAARPSCGAAGSRSRRPSHRCRRCTGSLSP